MTMNIAIRVDASDQIGTGHLMRCLTLADALRARGVELHFVSRHMQAHLQHMVRDHGHQFTLLAEVPAEPVDELAHARWLGISQESDAQAAISVLAGRVWDWLIVDHYALDVRWEKTMRNVVKRIMVIDDIADRQHDCDALLDQNFYANMEDRYLGKVPSDCRLLLGPRYALLRDEFLQLREQIKPRVGPVKRILVFFGGVDVSNYTALVIEALKAIDRHDLQINVVIGARHPARAEIEAACLHDGFICHVQTERMAELMASADFSIGSGGGATWERCCLGLPTLAFCVADNQYQQLADAAMAGLVYVPDSREDVKHSIRLHLNALMENSPLRAVLSANGMQAVDGRGMARVIKAFDYSSIEIRTATMKDSRDLFNWRNDPAIRAVSRNTGPIIWEDHQRWLAMVSDDPDRILLIGMVSGMPVGVVRYDMNGDSAEVSVYLVPDQLSSGLGAELLMTAEKWLRQQLPKIQYIHAHILSGNERSTSLFASAGYVIDSTRFTKRLLQNE